MNSSSMSGMSTSGMSMSGMDMGGMDMGGDDDCKISMLWNWYTIDACFLASSWHITSRGMFAASCIGIALLVVVLEGLRRLGKEYDAYLLSQFHAHLASQAKAKRSCHDLRPVAVFRATPLQQAIRAVLHAITFGLGYILMLLAMYFNGYIIISIILGAALGKFVCDWLVVKVVLPSPSRASSPNAIDGADGYETKRALENEDITMCCA